MRIDDWFLNQRTLVWCAFLTFVLFVSDFYTPDSVASGVLYVLVVFLSLGTTKRSHTYFFAVLTSLLTFLGLNSPYHIFTAYPNILIALCAIWGTVLLGLRYKQGKEAHLYLAALVESSEEIIQSITLDGRITSWNKASEDLYGYKAEEVVGKHIHIIVPPECAHETEDILRRIKAGEKITRFETTRCKKNGELVYVWLTMSPIKDPLGNILGVSILGRDITDRIQAEKNSQELRAGLQLEKSKLEQVLSIEEGLHRIVNIDKVVDFIVQSAVKVLGAERCSLMLLDKDSQELCIKSQYGLDVSFVESTRLLNDESISGFVAQHGNPLLVADIEADAAFGRANRPSCRSKSFMCVPIKVDDRVIGIINVTDKKGVPQAVFDNLDLKVLCMIARQAATAIENAMLYRELKYLAVTDPLTNMYNYRQFAKSLDREINRMHRYPSTLSILMLDIDDFKSYNDTYGHLAGDILLKSIGQVLVENIRAVDIACRYAGDEFVVILPETGTDQALNVAEKIKNKIMELQLKREVTCSIGIAQYRSGMTRYDLILKADMALYNVKREGKNRVGVHA